MNEKLKRSRRPLKMTSLTMVDWDWGWTLLLMPELKKNLPKSSRLWPLASSI